MSEPTIDMARLSAKPKPDEPTAARPTPRYIEDEDGAKSAALGQALDDLLSDGIQRRRRSQTEFLMPHRDALCKLKRQGASYTEIATQLSEKMGFAISAKAVGNVVGAGRRKSAKKSA